MSLVVVQTQQFFFIMAWINCVPQAKWCAKPWLELVWRDIRVEKHPGWAICANLTRVVIDCTQDKQPSLYILPLKRSLGTGSRFVLCSCLLPRYTVLFTFLHFHSPCLYLSSLLSSFQLMFGRFGQVVEKKKSISLQDISAVRKRLSLCRCICPFKLCIISFLCLIPSQEERRQLSSMLGCEISSMLCVPVVSRATGQVVALACAFNKQGGQR